MEHKFAKRVLKIKPSPTLSFNAKVKEMKEAGKDIVMFTAGEPDLKPPKEFEEGLKEGIALGKFNYTAVLGEKKLRELAAKYLMKYELDYKWEEIAITQGGKGGISNLLLALVEKGEEVVIPEIRWASYDDEVILAGGKPRLAEVNEDFKVTPESLRKAITRKTKLFILNSPANPTGAVYSREELTELAKVIVEKGIYVLSDEIYSEIVFEGEQVSIASLEKEVPGIKERTFTLNGASKSLAIPGLRIGYLAGDKEVIKKIDCIQGANASNPNSLTQWGVRKALETDLTGYFEEGLEAYQEKRKLMTEGLEGIQYRGKRAFMFKMPQGGFYLWVNIKNLKGKEFGRSSEEIALGLLEEAGVAAIPGKAFGDDNCLRFSFAVGKEEIKEGVGRLRKAIEG